MKDAVVSTSIELIGSKKNLIGKLLSFTNTTASTVSENRETYVMYGFTFREGDVFLNVEIESNLGDEKRCVSLYFNDETISIKDMAIMPAIGSGEARFRSHQRTKNRKWEEEGYIKR